MEYKFRGKRVDNGEWVYGGYQYEHSFGGTPNTYIIVYGSMGAFTGSQMIEVDPSTVGQFTGLKDKNGVEIYEGDVIKELGLKETWTLSRRDEFSERKHVITWVDYDLQWCGSLIEDDGDYELDTRHLSFLDRKYTLEIIGTIHDKEEV